MWFRSDLALFTSFTFQHVVQDHFDALHKGNAFHVRVEDAEYLESNSRMVLVGQLLWPVPGTLLETNGSDTLAGDSSNTPYSSPVLRVP